MKTTLPYTNKNKVLTALHFDAEKAKEFSDEIDEAIKAAENTIALQEFSAEIKPTFCDDKTLSFGNVSMQGDCGKLKNCSLFVFYAATLGNEVSSLTSRLFDEDPFEAMVCDTFANCALGEVSTRTLQTQKEAHKPLVLTNVVEIGTSVFEVSQLKPFFQILKQDEITLCESFLMNPQKSIAFLMCFSENGKCAESVHDCAKCKAATCPFRQDKRSTVFVNSEKGTDKIQVPLQTPLSAVFERLALTHVMPCGGHKNCGNCKVKIKNATPPNENDLAALSQRQLDDGYRLACKYVVTGDITVDLPSANAHALTDTSNIKNADEKGIGLAVDMGTTTVAVYAVDRSSGKVLSTRSFLNPQAEFGADVVSRIQFALNNNEKTLQSVFCRALNEQATSLLEEIGKTKTDTCILAGNCVMLHTLFGEKLSSFAQAPFGALFLSSRTTRGAELGLTFCNEITAVASISPFVGGDITAGILATELRNGNNLLIDLGTNGEIALSYNGNLYVCSTAAGPALEGGELSCGMGGVDGAIHTIKITSEKVDIKFYGVSPRGICGSGVLQALSEMKANGIIDENGTFVPNSHPSLKDKTFYLTSDVCITQKDIRSVQLAKAAIAAGIKTLLNVAHADNKDIEHVYIGGAFGNYVKTECLFALGILDKNFENKTILKGNTSAQGAIEILCNAEKEKYAEKEIADAQTVALDSNPVFTDYFIDCMEI